ncbi:MAG: UDP-3-O-(3-hydroxymyristoyl) glucosamine N-acyltransferase [Hyphomicrobiales bacterium]|nr:UDP-3-O-(3-hydroxymyristoyl) glucosamine N-acyltransferase [Hyphomicrobiales bacterium]
MYAERAGAEYSSMSDPVFFRRAASLSLSDIVEITGAKAASGDLSATVDGIAPLDAGVPGTLVFLDNPKYAGDLAGTHATACLVTERFAARVPAGTVALVTPEPYAACAKVSARLFPDSMRPGSLFGATGISPGSYVHPEARLEPGVVVDPGAVIGPRAEIGEGTCIGPNAVIGPDVRIGRQCSIGPNATVVFALVGDRVILHPGVRIGQDGFGFAMSPRGHLKVPQIGRVIIQNDVEIGANCTIDRGANRDTVIGEGSKIDNLVQIGHNVTVGRHCIIVSQVGVSGSTDLGDFVALGGQAGITGHLKIGMGAQIAAQSGVMTDVPAGERWGGAPAQPMREYLRSIATLARMGKSSSKATKKDD